MVFKKKESTDIKSPAVVKAETPLMIRVRTRGDKRIITIDANKVKDYKKLYLHVSWNNFTD